MTIELFHLTFGQFCCKGQQRQYTLHLLQSCIQDLAENVPSYMPRFAPKKLTIERETSTLGIKLLYLTEDSAGILYDNRRMAEVILFPKVIAAA